MSTQSLARRPSGGAAPTPLHTEARTRLSAIRFTTLLLVACLFLQRFGLPVGSQSISVCGPIGIGLAAWGVAEGTLSFHRTRLGLYLILWALAMAGAAWEAMHPNSFGVPIVWNSLWQFLLLTGFATLTFAQPQSERAFFVAVNRVIVVIAAAGVVQFVIQFAGVQIFQFTGLLPERILYETGYNLQIPVGIGTLYKANGFFLIEPSVFSQFMAIGLIIEALSFRRMPFLVLFVTGLLLSFSGTGWIVLLGFAVTATLSLGKRGAVIGLGALLILGTLLGALAALLPEVAAVFSERAHEFQTPGTSAQLRFITPFWVLQDVMAREPTGWLVGIGAGAAERITLPYLFNVNTPIKILMEYGLPALVAYVSLYIVGQRTRTQGALVVPALLLIFITGGYQQFPPVLFPVLLLIGVARLRPDLDVAAPVPRF